MAGSLVDLSRPGTILPRRLVIDSNLIIAKLLATMYAPSTQNVARSAQFFSLLQTSGAIGFVTWVNFNEVFHFAIKAKYRAELPNNQTILRARFPNVRSFDWHYLYKIEPGVRARPGTIAAASRSQRLDLSPAASSRPASVRS